MLLLQELQNLREAMQQQVSIPETVISLLVWNAQTEAIMHSSAPVCG